MDIKEFWKLMSLVDQDALDECEDEEAVEPVVSVLSSKTEEEINQFQEYLSQALYALDGQKWMEESGESSDSGDGFLYARCYVVAKGYEQYAKILNNPSDMPKNSDQWAEPLIYVASRAWALLTGREDEEYDYETTVSYESFSNAAQW